MIDENRFVREIEDWLSEGPRQAPDTVLSGVLVAFPRTARRRDLRHPFGTPGRRQARAITVGIAAALILLALGLWSIVGVGTRPTLPPPSVSPTSRVDPNRVRTEGWVPYVSGRFGYTISHPPGWTVRPATGPWAKGTALGTVSGDRDDLWSTGTDGFGILVASQPIAADADVVEWLRGHERRSGLLEACYPPPERMERTMVAGYPAYIHGAAEPCRFFEAIVFVDGRVYSLLGTGFTDPGKGPPLDRAHFDAFLSTVRFDPASAKDPD